MRHISCVLLAVLTACAFSTARAEVPIACKSSSDSKLAIDACSAFLQSPGISASDKSMAYSFRGFAYLAKFSSKDVEEALADANRSIELAPNNPNGYNLRGTAYSRQGKFDRAIKDLNHGLELNPSFSGARSTRCLLYQYRDEPQLALEDCNRAVELSPQTALPYNVRGVFYINSKQYDLALADLNRAIELAPQGRAPLVNRGRLHVEMGQLDKGLADLNRVLDTDPNVPFAYRTRAGAYIKQGRLDQALNDLMRAIELDPEQTEAFIDRAEVYVAKNHRDLAIADLRKALSLPARRIREREAQTRAAELLTSLTQNASNPKSASPPTQANDAPSGRRVALVIGNSAYTTVGTLKNPANDAKIVAATMKRVGFTEVTEGYDLGLVQMTAALKDFGDRAENAEWAVIYFAGHGIEMKGVPYLIPIDAKLERDTHVPDETVPLDRMLQKAENARKLRLIILDACRNNPFVTRMARVGSSTRSIARGLPPIEPEGDVLVAYATKHGTTAMDGEGDNSPFALALVENIPMPNVDIRVMFGRVRDSVRKITNNQQEPYTYGSVGGDLLFFVAAGR